MSTPATRSRTRTKKANVTAKTSTVHEIEDEKTTEESIEEHPSLQSYIISETKTDTVSKLNSYSVVSQVLCNDFLFRVGDVVSLWQNNCTYYAQIRVLVEDNFSEKYAALVWLLPTSCEEWKGDFNPYIFTYGPQDEWFYNMREMSFVMHAPTDFFKRFISPVPKDSNLVHVVKYKFKPSAKRKS